jgi:hypothetical protein
MPGSIGPAAHRDGSPYPLRTGHASDPKPNKPPGRCRTALALRLTGTVATRFAQGMHLIRSRTNRPTDAGQNWSCGSPGRFALPCFAKSMHLIRSRTNRPADPGQSCGSPGRFALPASHRASAWSEGGRGSVAAKSQNQAITQSGSLERSGNHSANAESVSGNNAILTDIFLRSRRGRARCRSGSWPGRCGSR